MDVVDTAASAQWEERLHAHLARFYGEVLGLPEAGLEKAIADRTSLMRGRRAAKMLDAEIGLEGKRMLDVGSGWGELVVSCHELGADVTGIEPDPDEVDIARLLLRSYGLRDDVVVTGRGESLPWPDASFDVVCCQQVLEHVQDIDQVISELIRVLRPGGRLFVSVPNYLFPYEGHYRMKWVPLTPKPIGRLVLRAAGRDPDFLLNHVNYTTYPMMVRKWRRHGLHVRNVTLERARKGTHGQAVYSSALRRVIIGLRLFPNVTWILTKPA